MVEGRAEGRVLRLTEPISFWGGVDQRTGEVCDRRHAQHGASLAGRIVAIPETVGSSSSSAIMLELMRIGRAPRALLLGQVDPILTFGGLVGREIGYETFPVVAVTRESIDLLRDGMEASVSSEGVIELEFP